MQTVYGWNTSKLKDAIATLVTSTGYTGRVHTSFDLSATRICIRPDNRLSRALSSTLVKALLWVTLIYPFIWLFKRFSRAGGGRWEVFGGAFGLVHLTAAGEQDADIQAVTHSKSPSDDTDPEEGGSQDIVSTLPSSSHPVARRTIAEIPPGSNNLHDVLGYREGEWFHEWEDAIRRCVVNRVRETEPMRHGFRGPALATEQLDGYREALEGYQ